MLAPPAQRRAMARIKREHRWASRLVALAAVLAVAASAHLLGAFETPERGPDGLTAAGRRLMSYPDEPLGREKLDQGWVVLYILGMCYTFVALALVCDSYFVPALEVLVEKIDMSYDVAGATFMAAGGSAPELATSFIGTFVSKSDVGVGTIVGSAVFNVLFVIGMVAITSRNDPQRAARAASKVEALNKEEENPEGSDTALKLTWWPLARDTTFYAIFLAFFAYFFWDQNITWFEALVLFGFYGVYCGAMVMNEELGSAVQFVLRLSKNPALREPEEVERQQNLINNLTFSGGVIDVLYQRANTPKKRFQHGVRRVIERNLSSRATELARSSSSADASSADAAPADSSAPPPAPAPPASADAGGDGFAAVVAAQKLKKKQEEARIAREAEELAAAEAAAAGDAGDDDIDTATIGGFEPFHLPKTWRATALWVFLWPIATPVYLTTPNVHKARWRNWYPLTFFWSIVWIGAHSYLMVWWATIVGDVFGIPESVMGVSVLAAGTSVPDLITSVLVARRGLGDMAVSSSIGSNIFDVAVGLPLPWLLYTLINGESLDVGSEGLVVSVSILLGMSILTVTTIYCFRWRLTKPLGYVMLVFYLVFLVVSILLEV